MMLTSPALSGGRFGEYLVGKGVLGAADLELALSMLPHYNGKLGDTLVATASSNPRALSAAELARLASRWFTRTEQEPDPAAALDVARAIAGPRGAVLVTGSLYLLADLAGRGEGVPSNTGRDSASSSSPPS